MNGSISLLIAAFFPVVAAPVVWSMGRRDGKQALMGMVASTAVELALLLILAFGGMGRELTIDGFIGMGLRMKADGFRVLYACIACVMWLVTSIFSRDYLKHDHAPGRYAFFTLLTQGATVGLFLSDSIFTAFCFFEVMSMASYPWVAHEEEPEAMRAAETYLYIAVIGGLVMLMGIFLLPAGMATASYHQLAELASGQNLWLAAALILVGFGAKAGAFPIHIWLPKAHPVAPAPASALLSGMLTKAGVLGMLILTLHLMRGVTSFANLIFWLGTITMFLGAFLAIFSTNLKRTLACSSLSQIGFIMVGVGTQGLCVCENGLAAFGTIQHMMNHSLFKLVLFLCAGIVAMNIHALKLDDVRGFGRKKPLMHFCFVLAAAGISGIPGLSGYISKSLLHEGLVEYIHELHHHHLNALPYEIAEWVFIISGGMTLCYMTKLYICLFWQKHPTRQDEFDGMKKYMSLPSAIALCAAACVVPVLGLLPDLFMTGVGQLAQPFMNAADPHHMPVPYFSHENLVGAAKSIVIGIVLFFLQRQFVMKKGAYPERWPKWLDLENSVYRPFIGLLIKVGYGFAWVVDHLTDWALVVINAAGGFCARLFDTTGDGLAMSVRRLFLPQITKKQPIPVGNRLTYAVGRALDSLVAFHARLTGRKVANETHYASLLAAGQHEATTEFKRFTRSVSFGLFMFCVGLIVTLVFLLIA